MGYAKKADILQCDEYGNPFSFVFMFVHADSSLKYTRPYWILKLSCAVYKVKDIIYSRFRYKCLFFFFLASSVIKDMSAQPSCIAKERQKYKVELGRTKKPSCWVLIK